MKRGVSVLSVLTIAAVSSIVAAPAYAQHLHAHGNHFHLHQNVPHGHDGAGHLVDRMGHHIDGDGRHTGAMGVYENGSVGSPYGQRWNSYYPSYSYPSYLSPYYSSSLYSNSLYANSLYGNSLYGNPLYSASQYAAPSAVFPRVLPSAPAVNAPAMNAPAMNAPGLAAAAAVRNRIPLPPPAGRGGSFVLTNPADSGGPIRYSLNSFAYTINPGEAQTVPLDRDWVITFDNGLNKTVSYRMQDGAYDFTVAPDIGWDLVKRTPQAPPGADAVAAPDATLDATPFPQTQPDRRAL